MNLHEQFDLFMQDMEQRCSSVGVNFEELCIDHICRRVESNQEFANDKKSLVHKSLIYTEGPFNNRLFCVFLLKEPLCYKDHKVRYVELPQPGGAGMYKRGFQHIEVIAKTLFDGVNFGQHEDYHAYISYGGKICIKWPDLVALKVTPDNLFAKVLTEDAVLQYI